ncbi:hypothetical protein [Nonomuraea sp. NPDC049141]|uniref:hypothetical protein n=1 Tax=unclassified Nonomuraea TaxID=2593643 RepID=UPI0033DF30D5
MEGVADVQTFLIGTLAIGTVHVMQNVLSAALKRAMREEILGHDGISVNDLFK